MKNHRESLEPTRPDKVPPFFDDDMFKWRKKFEKEQKDRNLVKKSLKEIYEIGTLTTKNSNVQKNPFVLPKRRFS